MTVQVDSHLQPILKLLNYFFSPTSSGLAPGVYTEQELRTLIGTNQAFITQQQWAYDDGLDDYAERVYIWNTVAFEIEDNARFIIDANGDRFIENFAVIPHSNTGTENFDFESNDLGAILGNLFALEERVDPSGIGRQVEISFEGTRTTTRYEFSDYQNDTASVIVANPLLLTTLYEEITSLTDKLFKDGALQFLEGHKPILYSADGGGTIDGTVSTTGVDLADHRYLKDYVNNGFYYVGGDGNDTIIATDMSDVLIGGDGNDDLDGGADSDYLYGQADNDVLNGGDNNDYLYGGTGNDHLYGGLGRDELYGEDGDDVLDGGDGADYLNGGEGLDVLYGGTGNDILVGNLEDDILEGGEGEDTYLINTKGATTGVATLNDIGKNKILIDGVAVSYGISSGENTWKTADGKFTITQNSPLTVTDQNGNRVILNDSSGTQFGLKLVELSYTSVSVDTDGDNVIEVDTLDVKRMAYGGAGSQLIYGDPIVVQRDDIYFADVETTTEAFLASDTGVADDTRDWLSSEAGNDVLFGSHGENVLLGGVESDLILAGAGDDHIFGDGNYRPLDADGNETINWKFENDHLSSVDGYGTGTLRYASVDVLNPDYTWGSHDDTIYAGSGNDYIEGGLDNDTVFAGTGDDTVRGDNGNDSLLGEEGDDIIFGDSSLIDISEHGDDYMDGGAGNDQLQGNGGNDTILGGTEDDIILGDSHASQAEYFGHDRLEGGAGNDEIQGNGGDDQLDGGAGNDILFGDDTAINVDFHGDDIINGGTGNDILIGGAGIDQLLGGDDDDYLDGDGYSVDGAKHANDFLDGGKGNDVLYGAGGSDSLFGGDDNDILIGDAPYISTDYHGDDYLSGGAGDDQLYGDNGNDVLEGGEGNDTLEGGEGNDYLYGGKGNDTIYLGAGDDVIDGGEGYDTFYYNFGSGNDTIIDEGSNRLVFDFPFSIYMLTLGLGSLKITINDSGDAIHLENFDADDVYGKVTIDSFEFSGGTVLSYHELLELGFDFEGTAADDYLVGTSGKDRLNGYAGNDTIIAKAGDNYFPSDVHRNNTMFVPLFQSGM